MLEKNTMYQQMLKVLMVKQFLLSRFTINRYLAQKLFLGRAESSQFIPAEGLAPNTIHSPHFKIGFTDIHQDEDNLHQGEK